MLDTSSQSVIKDNIPSIIEEPALKDRKSCLRRGCAFGFGLALFAVAALIIISIFFQKPKPTKLASLPPNFPLSIPLYKFEERAVINFYAGDKKDRLAERLAANVFNREKWRDLPKIISAPSAARDINTIEIVWEDLDATLKQIENYYKKNLASEGFAIGVAARDPARLTLIFSKGAVIGTLRIEQPKRTEGSSVILRVDYQK